MRKPSSHKAIVGECKRHKLGRTLAVGEVAIYSESEPVMVVHVTRIYVVSIFIFYYWIFYGEAR